MRRRASEPAATNGSAPKSLQESPNLRMRRTSEPAATNISAPKSLGKLASVAARDRDKSRATIIASRGMSSAGIIGATARGSSSAGSAAAAAKALKAKLLNSESAPVLPSPMASSTDMPSSGCGSLRSRRLQTGKLEISTDKKQGVDGSSSSCRNRRKIKSCADIRDKYELGQEVTLSVHSGMHVLYGKQRSTSVEVVVKVRIKSTSFHDAEEETEWRTSTEWMLNLPQNGNIAQIYEVLEDAEAYYVVMEKCVGQDLFDSIHNSKLTPAESKEVVFQILQALAEMHAKGLIHKDLKLENVMLDRSEDLSPKSPASVSTRASDSGSSKSPVQIKVVDFDTVVEHTPKTPKRAKDVLGTDQYIAQEAYAGMYSPASDVFAVGVIAYRLLAGKYPYDKKMFNDGPGENWVGSPKMRQIREQLRKFKVDFELGVFRTEPLAGALLKKMLATDEKDRPTA
eukprot:CAMPEP_0115482372 /NCGR_PEP_ID=MMETSP0271-20121206/58295_1 /TAXON_ID=71861 /ORGANISM="Scrippsiella trochoidea, Strain CCMP3099" /LENGTH=455 /DNA_ID=CAMNT_0002910167 /DNA_START=47 /DNA_END=1411 /DNA_ORIENTATION=+